MRSSQTSRRAVGRKAAAPAARSRWSSECPVSGAPAGGGGARDQNHKTEEIVNYEISRTTKTEVIEAGRVNRISAAVLVDGIYSRDSKGETAYPPRSEGRDRPHRRCGAIGHRLQCQTRRSGRGGQFALRREPPMPIDEPAAG